MVTPRKPVCAECRERTSIYSRGICAPCWRAPGVRDKYAPGPSGRRTGYGLGGSKDDPPAPHPTDAPPGSLEKMAVIQWRLRNGYALFHPGDAAEAVTELVNPFSGLATWAGGPTGLENAG